MLPPHAEDTMVWSIKVQNNKLQEVIFSKVEQCLLAVVARTHTQYLYKST